ncbi:MAG TPA: NAD(P)H-hydrate epimerase [Planctomycetota bacterium]|nr:NAD(P)H-hydrate epimerase [Planctomycetota bacterium]
MSRHVTRSEMAEIDRRTIDEFGIPESALMERAGGAVAAEIRRRWPGRPVDVLCGPGRNGGDGRVVARLLGGRVIAPGEAWTPAPRAVVVDALFGTGLNRDVAGPARSMIEAVDALDRAEHPVIAVDIPSGMDADSGLPRGAAVRADVTVTMGLPKAGFLSPGAAAHLGILVIADIGHPPELIKGDR